MRLNQGNGCSGLTLIECMVITAVLAILILLLFPAHTGNKLSAKHINCINNLKEVGLAFRQWANDHNGKLPTEVSVTNGGAMEAVIAGNVAAVYQVMSNELSTPKILFCPADKRKIQAVTFDRTATAKGWNKVTPFLNNSNVSYFVGLDARFSTPEMFLSGDDNLLVGGKANIQYGAFDGVAVKPGVLSLWTNTPAAWSDERHGRRGYVCLTDGSVQSFSSGKLAAALRNTGSATNRLAFP